MVGPLSGVSKWDVSAMPVKLSRDELVDREFLEIRCRLIDIAASLDRLDRSDAGTPIVSDPRGTKLIEAIRLLTDSRGDRTRRVQMVFSDTYDGAWRSGRSVTPC